MGREGESAGLLSYPKICAYSRAFSRHNCPFLRGGTGGADLPDELSKLDRHFYGRCLSLSLSVSASPFLIRGKAAVAATSLLMCLNEGPQALPRRRRAFGDARNERMQQSRSSRMYGAASLGGCFAFSCCSCDGSPPPCRRRRGSLQGPWRCCCCMWPARFSIL